MKKLRVIAVTMMIIIISVLSQGTLAYYSTSGKASSVVTTGNVKLKIHELDENGNPFNAEGVYVMPGDIVTKRVSVENVGSHPFYLRIKLIEGTSSAELSAKDCMQLDIDTINWTYKDGWYYFNKIVDVGATTTELFTKVNIVGKKIDRNYIDKFLTLKVTAQAVQSENNPIVNGDVTTANGWPKQAEE